MGTRQSTNRPSGVGRLLRRMHGHQKRPLPPSFLKATLIAHRGRHTKFPENSLGALRAAAALRLPVEIDVQLSADGHLVVFHDETLERMAGVRRHVRACTLDALRAYPLHHEGESSDERIPTLEEALATVDVGVLLEIKAHYGERRDVATAVLRALERFADARDRVVIQSFSPKTLQRVRMLDPSYCRCQLFCSAATAGGWPLTAYLRQRLMYNWMSQPDAVAGELALLTEPRVRRYREDYGYTVLGWTGRSAEDLARARSRGVDIVISDYGAPDGQA